MTKHVVFFFVVLYTTNITTNNWNDVAQKTMLNYWIHCSKCGFEAVFLYTKCPFNKRTWLANWWCIKTSLRAQNHKCGYVWDRPSNFYQLYVIIISKAAF